MRKFVFLLLPLLLLRVSAGTPVHADGPIKVGVHQDQPLVFPGVDHRSLDRWLSGAGEQTPLEGLKWGVILGAGLLLLLLGGALVLRVQIRVRTRELQAEIAERQRAQEKLAALHALDRELVLTDDVQRIADAVVEAASRVLEFRLCGLWLVDQTSDMLVRYAHTTYAPVLDIESLPLDGGHGVTVAVARSGEPIYLPDVLADPRYISPGFAVRSELCVPLKVRGRVIGVLNAESAHPTAFSDDDRSLFQTLADVAAVALENARLHRTVADLAARLEQSVAERIDELREEQARMQAILDAAGEGIIVTNLSGAILYMNPAASRLTGYSLAEASLDTPRLWKSGKHPRQYYQQMWTTILSGEVWRGELINRRKDGTPYDAALTIAPIFGGDGRPMGFVGIQNDISHKKELDRLKDEFVSNVSHELRTPLSNIRLYLSLLQRGKEERRAHHLKVLQSETNRLGGLIEDLLDLSRLDRAETVSMEPVDLEALAADVLTNHLPRAEANQIELSFDLQSNLPPAWADRAKIVQVLTNLVGNALAYTPAGGHVTVSLSQDNSDGRAYIMMAVADDGPGISPKDKPHIFERFYRGAAGRQSAAPGTGLGLSICKKIVDLHEGRINVESEEGQGATFNVWLPVSPRDGG